MTVKSGLLYAASHEWVRVEGDEAVVGITWFAQDQLGDLTFVELPAVGTKLKAGDEMGSVESVKAASEIYSPVTGEVIAVNDELENSPEDVNDSPYDSGWMIRFKLSEAPKGLMDAEAYKKHITNSQDH